ncbi:hypothetical protein CFP56_001452 [Quercus suber]|uniref:Uncharacterized protein n=1 Tax=Quercus suber TaxID=58331 RepID=A0AAW0ILP1_QUESU
MQGISQGTYIVLSPFSSHARYQLHKSGTCHNPLNTCFTFPMSPNIITRCKESCPGYGDDLKFALEKFAYLYWKKDIHVTKAREAKNKMLYENKLQPNHHRKDQGLQDPQ